MPLFTLLNKISLLGIICFLWILGGQRSNRYRDVGVPILLGLGIGWLTKNIWLAILTCATYNVIRTGYGNYEPSDSKNSFLANLLKDRQGRWIRAFWGLIVASIGALPLVIWYYCSLKR